VTGPAFQRFENLFNDPDWQFTGSLPCSQGDNPVWSKRDGTATVLVTDLAPGAKFFQISRKLGKFFKQNKKKHRAAYLVMRTKGKVEFVLQPKDQVAATDRAGPGGLIFN
jgi:hypothetical protein